jgi:DNA-binding transcriptional MerR regulator
MGVTHVKETEDGRFFHHNCCLRSPTYGTGDAAEILGIPIWRLQKYLDSGQYNLSPTGKLGSGRGSRRVFTREDLHRIALANWLVKDGFAPQFVGSVVQQLEDDEVGVYLNHEGEETSLCVAFYRGAEGPVVRVHTVRNAPALGHKTSPFYRLDLDDVFAEVDQRIAKLQKA